MFEPLEPLPADATYDDVTDKLKEIAGHFDAVDDELARIIELTALL